LVKKKEPQAKPLKTSEKENDLIGQTISLVEHLFSYFETLLIYARKIIRDKFKEALLIFCILYLLLGFLFIGFLFLVASGFIYFLRYFNNDIAITSVAMGGSFVILSFLIFLLLIKKFRDIT